MSDKNRYRLIADELKTNKVDVALWTQAKETALGDTDKTEAIYIRLRFLELVRSVTIEQKTTKLAVSENAALPVKPVMDELSRVRAALRVKLANQKKHNLYSTLKLHPDASDTAILTAIVKLESEGMANADISAAEFKYAKDILSDSSLREQYDRELYDSLQPEILHDSLQPRGSYNSLQPRISPVDESHGYEENYQDGSWWASRKTSVTIKTSVVIVIASLFMLGYLGINFMAMNNYSELQKFAVARQQAVIKLQEENEQDMIRAYQEPDMELRAEKARIFAERQAQEMELRNVAADRMREEKERRIQAEEQRKQAQKEQDEQRRREQQEREENFKIIEEKRYWSCMNLQLSQPNSNGTSYDARARCAR